MRAALDEVGREVLEQALNHLEPADTKQVEPKVRYHKQTYRRNKRTPADVASTFGVIGLRSFLYLCTEDGEPGLHPLHVRLGVVHKATPLLAERAARWSVAHPQTEVRQLLRSEHGLTWSNDRLRAVVKEFHRTVAPWRQAMQQQRLLAWLDQAQKSRGRHRPVLAVGRDGIMVPIRGQGYQEASTATLAVYDRRRRRLGTVYLGQMPEAHQTTLSRELTALLQAVLQAWAGPLPRLVFVTDKGQAPEAYYRRVLRKMKNPRRPEQRLEWEWVLDFYHVSGYVGKMANALFGLLVSDRQAWFGRMRRWLRDRAQGVANILRSALQLYQRRTLTKAEQKEFWNAYRYLRRHSRWMDYHDYRRRGLPIGSGVTEAACKTVFTQRFKCSGMRWHKESGQTILDLRVLYLSGVWHEAVARDLRSRPLPEVVRSSSQRRKSEKTLKIAA